MNTFAATTVVIFLLCLGGWFGYALGTARQEAQDIRVFNEIDAECVTMVPRNKLHKARDTVRRKRSERAH